MGFNVTRIVFCMSICRGGHSGRYGWRNCWSFGVMVRGNAPSTFQGKIILHLAKWKANRRLSSPQSSDSRLTFHLVGASANLYAVCIRNHIQKALKSSSARLPGRYALSSIANKGFHCQPVICGFSGGRRESHSRCRITEQQSAMHSDGNPCRR
jgi:hypothetical protein